MKKRIKGFTLAEVLITMTIIGVVAAISIPVLQANTAGKEYNAARQKVRMSAGEAFKLMTVNGELDGITTAAEAVKDAQGGGLNKYLKIMRTCNTATECGFSSKIKTAPLTTSGNTESLDTNSTLNSWNTLTRSKYYTVTQSGGTGASGNYSDYGYTTWANNNNTKIDKPAYFQTVDGISYALYVNPNCAGSPVDLAYANSWGAAAQKIREDVANDVRSQFSGDAICLYAVYDMNGAKGPNEAGKDIGFVGSFYNGISARSAAALPGKRLANAAVAKAGVKNARQLCREQGSEWDLPSVDELSLLFLGNKLVDSSTDSFWSRSSVPGSSLFFYVYFGTGGRSWGPEPSIEAGVRCARKDVLK